MVIGETRIQLLYRMGGKIFYRQLKQIKLQREN